MIYHKEQMLTEPGPIPELKELHLLLILLPFVTSLPAHHAAIIKGQQPKRDPEEWLTNFISSAFLLSILPGSLS